MKIAIIQFPGSTGLLEIASAIERAGMTSVLIDAMQYGLDLEDMQGYILPGGYSFNDEPSPGIIAASLPIISVLAQQSELGKPILGIGNGAQILATAGLIPGVENNKRVVALTENQRLLEGRLVGKQAYHAWANIKLSTDYQRNAFTSKLSVNDVISMPLACSHGRFVLSEALLYEIKIHGLNIFEYVDDALGSTAKIAAISNKAGNVLAMMPHPEYTPAGDAIFLSMKEYIDSGYKECVQPLNYYPRQYVIANYAKPLLGREFIFSTPALKERSAYLTKHLRQPVQCLQYIETSSEDMDVTRLLIQAGLISEGDMLTEGEQHKSAFLIRPRTDLLGIYLTQTYQKTSDAAITINTAHIWAGVSTEHLSLVFNPIIEDGYHYNK